jgi:hypothetical protein
MCKKVEMCGQNLVNMFNFITEMDSQTEKRMRGANFSADEKALLLVTVQKYNNIINCKKSDATTWKENEAAWEKIGKEFNAQSPARIYRELPSLKTIYKNTKGLTKRVAANEKRESRATGGARAPEGDKPDFYELALGTIDRDTVFVLPENGGDISSEEENGHETSTTITQSTENLQEVATTSIQGETNFTRNTGNEWNEDWRWSTSGCEIVRNNRELR